MHQIGQAEHSIELKDASVTILSQRFDSLGDRLPSVKNALQAIVEHWQEELTQQYETIMKFLAGSGGIAESAAANHMGRFD